MQRTKFVKASSSVSDSALRTKELKLKERELELRSEEIGKPVWRIDVLSAIFAALVAGGFTVWQVGETAKESRNLERAKWLQGREDERVRNLGAAMADLSQHYHKALYEISLLAEIAAGEPQRYYWRDLDRYRSSMSAHLPSMLHALSVVHVYSPEAHSHLVVKIEDLSRLDRDLVAVAKRWVHRTRLAKADFVHIHTRATKLGETFREVFGQSSMSLSPSDRTLLAPQDGPQNRTAAGQSATPPRLYPRLID